jgi:hypothetical protein
MSPSPCTNGPPPFHAALQDLLGHGSKGFLLVPPQVVEQ